MQMNVNFFPFIYIKGVRNSFVENIFCHVYVVYLKWISDIAEPSDYKYKKKRWVFYEKLFKDYIMSYCLCMYEKRKKNDLQLISIKDVRYNKILFKLQNQVSKFVLNVFLLFLLQILIGLIPLK